MTVGRIGTEAARQALREREEMEDDVWVREEIATALGEVLVPRTTAVA